MFVKAIERKRPSTVPFIELLSVAKKPFFIVLVAAMAESASGFFFLVFGYSFAVNTLKIPASTLLQAMLIGSVLALFLTPMYGALSDRIGRRIALSCAYLIAGTYTAFFFFPLLESGDKTLIMLAMIIPLVTSNPISLGVIGSFYSEQFADARLRYSGVGVGRGLGTTLGGGLMPVIATGLMALAGGSRLGPIIWFCMICAGAIIAILIARETKDEKLG